MSIVHIGISPKPGQTVAPSLANRNIHLNRVAPSGLKPTVTVETHQPSHEVYKKFLVCYICACHGEKAIRLSEPYMPIPINDLPSFTRTPKVIWSYATKLSPEKIEEIRTRYSAEEVVIKGKAGFVASLSIEQVRRLTTANDLTPVYTTPANPTCMNLMSYRSYLVALRTYEAICRTNQYPFMRNNDDELEDGNLSCARTYVRFDEDDAKNGSDGGTKTLDIMPSMWRAYSNVSTPFANFDYRIRSAADIPANHSGLIFPYVEDLALPDGSVVPEFLYRHMFFSFGADRTDCVQGFESFKTGWGAMVGTTWEMELTHLYWVLGAALEAQSTTRVIVDNAGKYQGSMILGGGFSIQIGKEGTNYSAVSHADLVSALPRSTPHLGALTEIYANIIFTNDEARAQAVASCLSMHDIRSAIALNGATERTGQAIDERAPFLSFPNDPPFLSVTAHNIQTVLQAIADPGISERQFPLHYSALRVHNRSERLLSAFGVTAPSFRVPGGKEMSLERSFEATRKGADGKMESVAVRKIAVVMKPYREAFSDLSTVISTRKILNPFGSAVVGRISSNSLLRSFERESCDGILGALRGACSISALMGGGEASKRKHDDDQEMTAKRPRMFDF